MPKEFFAKADRRELAGVTEGDHVTMCTSSPVVRKWLGESLTHVFKAVPDLAGVFTITASENLTNCASHGQSAACPHCKNRKPGDIIAEVNKTIEQGVHAAAPNARFIAWDWGWPDSIAPDIIAALPASTWLMSVSEWSLPLDRGGVKSSAWVNIPSPPSARDRGLWIIGSSPNRAVLRAIAKVQASNTWELSAVPYLPVYDLIARHAGNLSRADVDGVMFSWSLGGYPSPNLEIFRRISAKQDPAGRARRPGGAAIWPRRAHARRAWSLLSEAFEQYPYSGATVYNAPQQFGPSNLFFAQPTHYHSTMIRLPVR